MSKSTDRRRHEALAKATASWHSWVADRWFCNGFMAVEVDEPFSAGPMMLDYECLCSSFDKHQHRHTLNRLCVFMDTYEAAPGMTDTIGNTLMKAKGDGRYARLDIEDTEVESENEPGLLIYRARINEDAAERAWIGLNKRFVDVIREQARPTRWWLGGLHGVPVGQPMPESMAPSVIAVRDERMVAAVMPMACTGSAIESRVEA